MIAYLIRRLFLLPITLFAIILVNFVILNLAPGDPTSMASLSATGEATRNVEGGGVTGENQYLLFREHYGLTLPVVFNTWPYLNGLHIKHGLEELLFLKEKLSVQKYHKLRTLWGDRARFIIPFLVKEASNNHNSFELRKIAANFIVRGGLLQGEVGPKLTQVQRLKNRHVTENNLLLINLRILETDSVEDLNVKVTGLQAWYVKRGGSKNFEKTSWEKIKIFLFETRFCRYLSRVVALDFGTLRNDSNRTVVHEVAKRIKYSLTLAVIPLLATFGLCQLFGMLMAVWHNRWIDYTLNIFFLFLFAVPVFVVAPFLIEKFALNKTLPFSNIPIPHNGFHSPQEIYDSMTSSQRLGDILLHIILPLIAIKYGTLSVQARLARTSFLEVLKQDYIRTAKAKGLSTFTILFKHAGRNSAITIVTSLATSLGVVLGGSLIVETLFEINGFGRFFYDAIVNRDFNVVLFSAFVGSFLTLIGFLIADIFYTFLDPRISLER